MSFIQRQGAKCCSRSLSCPLVNNPVPFQPELPQRWPQGRGLGGKMGRFKRVGTHKENEHNCIKSLGSLWLPKHSSPLSSPLLQLSPYVFSNDFSQLQFSPISASQPCCISSPRGGSFHLAWEGFHLSIARYIYWSTWCVCVAAFVFAAWNWAPLPLPTATWHHPRACSCECKWSQCLTQVFCTEYLGVRSKVALPFSSLHSQVVS